MPNSIKNVIPSISACCSCKTYVAIKKSLLSFTKIRFRIQIRNTDFWAWFSMFIVLKHLVWLYAGG